MIRNSHTTAVFCARAIVLVLVGVGIGAFAQDSNSTTSNARSHQSGDLNPDNPSAYFLLGESLIANASSSQEKTLSQEVLAIGMALAAQNKKMELAASMCITLATYESDPNQSAELWDLALYLDPARRLAWNKFRDRGIVNEQRIRMDAVKCIHAARFSQYDLASELFARDEIQRILSTSAKQAGLDPSRTLRSIALLIEDSSSDSCRGRVFITKREDGIVTREICPDHRRPIGTADSDESLNQLLRLESVLLAPLTDEHSNMDWGIISFLQLEMPVFDPSIARALEHYNVDISKPYRKGNKWVSSL